MLFSKTSLTAYSLVLAAALWFLTFIVRPLDFWIMLTLSTLALMMIAITVNREPVKVQVDYRLLLLGVVSGVLLYAFFFAGFQVTRSNPVFSEGVGKVYDLRSSAYAPLIALLLIFPIGPGEEIYWRWLIQRRFTERMGGNMGLMLATAAYALVHLPTLNPPLILTALIGGFVWGYIYKLTGAVMPVVVSHVLFDLLIFVVAPLS